MIERTRKTYWPVQTFVSETEKNYNAAINYYAQKKAGFMSAVQSQLLNSTTILKSTQSIEQIFQKTLSNIQNNFIRDWQTIYNKKFNHSEFQSAVKGWNSTVQNINSQTNQIQMAGILTSLLYAAGGNNDGTFFNQDLTSLRGISEARLHSLYTGYTTKGAKAKNWSGLRANYFGEIFENSIGSLFQNNLNLLLGPLLQFEQTGTRYTNNPSGRTQGKTDIAMSMNTIPTNFNLDANELIDFNDGNSGNILSNYLASGKGIAGINIKQWTNDVIGTTTFAGKASFGNFATSADLVNKRDPNGKISYIFNKKETFDAYMGYQVSRFLINILGAYNLIMATGSEIMFMDTWLRELRKTKNLLIVHGTKGGLGARKLASTRKQDTVYGYYEAKKNLVIIQH